MDSQMRKTVNGMMVEHAMKFAQGVLDVLHHDGAREYLRQNSAEAQELDDLLTQAEGELESVRLVGHLRKKGEEGGSTPPPNVNA